ncbi:NAD-dependent epimerase/dehydratase family protein [Agromyces larvae]|uniref:NAD(P)-dependent oxidoreductase n=1 Tax=Agromyces larvae TaxID=2929802 RepID=A0ABY4BUE5_9MICO|nr:NAD(P)-dependent oxidoreductase [Agromyces larvae]UOE42833.1 NAD(P)-dependent oxidoreductase [Agromyces larvae]
MSSRLTPLAGLSVVGASGFIGSAVARAAHKRAHWAVREIARSASPAAFDVRDADAVYAALSGTAVVVHAASYIGNDPDLCYEINVRGTENIAKAFLGSNGERLMYVSTAAVYGRGPFHMASERATSVRPSSALSKSRARAEQIVLDAGGVVVRPHLVLGVGDKWVGPGVIRYARTLGGFPRSSGDARHSVVEVSHLGNAIVDLLEAPDAVNCSVNVAQTTLSLTELVTLFAGVIDSVPAHAIGSTAPTSAQKDARLAHAASLLEVEHTFSTARIQALVDSPSLSAPFRLSRPERQWYREHDLEHSTVGPVVV